MDGIKSWRSPLLGSEKCVLRSAGLRMDWRENQLEAERPVRSLLWHLNISDESLNKVLEVRINKLCKVGLGLNTQERKLGPNNMLIFPTLFLKSKILLKSSKKGTSNFQTIFYLSLSTMPVILNTLRCTYTAGPEWPFWLNQLGYLSPNSVSLQDKPICTCPLYNSYQSPHWVHILN